MANWQRTGKKANKPKRVSPLAKGKDKRYGNAPSDRTPQEMQKMLARFGAAKEPSPESLQRQVDNTWVENQLALTRDET